MTGTAGVIQHFRQGNLRFSVSILLALAGSLASFSEGRLAHTLPSAYLAWLFAVLIGSVLWLYLRPSRTVQYRVLSVWAQRLVVLAIGGLAGFLSGMFGIGGGVLMTPLLQVFLSFSLAESIGTSLGAVVLIAGAGVIAHAWMGDLGTILRHSPWVLVVLGGCGMICAPWGAVLTRRISEGALKKVLFILMAGLCGYMLVLGLQVR